MEVSLPRKVLEKYITPGCAFIECGSRWGDTLIKAVELGAIFARGCEIERFLAHVADMHVSEVTKGVAFVSGIDSVPFLAASHEAAYKDVVVFLDAHTETHSPVVEELEEIAKWKVMPKAILIDDLRCMKGWGISIDDLIAKLIHMGYKVSHEEGVEYMDILVGTR